MGWSIDFIFSWERYDPWFLLFPFRYYHSYCSSKWWYIFSYRFDTGENCCYPQIIGTKSGECAIWVILSETQKLSLKALLFDHSAKINNICISEELGLFGTASDDGKINLYHSISGKIFRTIHHPQHLPINMVNFC